MSLNLLLIIVAVVASLLLVFRFKNRLLPVVALVASGMQALSAYGILHVASGVVSLQLVFAAAILVAGMVVWFQTKNRLEVTAATALALVGGLQLMEAMAVI